MSSCLLFRPLIGVVHTFCVGGGQTSVAPAGGQYLLRETFVSMLSKRRTEQSDLMGGWMQRIELEYRCISSQTSTISFNRSVASFDSQQLPRLDTVGRSGLRIEL